MKVDRAPLANSEEADGDDTAWPGREEHETEGDWATGKPGRSQDEGFHLSSAADTGKDFAGQDVDPPSADTERSP